MATESSAVTAARLWSRLRESVAIAVVGMQEPLRLLAAALLVGGHVLVEDVPGVGKTLLAKAFSRSLGMSFARIQGTPDLLPTDVTGSSVLEGASFSFQPGPIFSNVVLFDEINRATPRTQSALLEAMQERQVSWCWRRRTRSSSRERSRCPKRNSTGFWCASTWATSMSPTSATCCAA
jgi:MoxR-like ATPase